MDIGALVDGASIVCTGGSGTLGQALVSELLDSYRPHKVVIFSRSESRQAAMKERFSESESSPLRYFIGDVRDRQRLLDCFDGADIVIHAAALKRVDTCEREPKECVLTNVLGTLNAAEAARECGVQRFMYVSSDKASAASTLYGGSKYVAERLAIGMNNYRGGRAIKYSAVRYGNVLGSTGSVLHTFRACNGKVPITDPRMTRFWITPQQAARFVLSSLALMRGGECFCPKLPAMKIVDMAKAVAPNAEMQTIGIRGAEKLHECLISEDESPWAVELSDRYVLLPTCSYWPVSLWPEAKRLPDGFSFTSANAPIRLTPAALKEMVNAG